MKFVGKQHYAKSTHFEVLQPLLNQVVQDSERLTVLIFCDGEGKISGTPYDAGINQFFQEKLAEQKKARQPFVIVLRSQLGQYVGCTIGLAAAAGELSRFPPLPLPPPPPAPSTDQRRRPRRSSSASRSSSSAKTPGQRAAASRPIRRRRAFREKPVAPARNSAGVANQPTGRRQTNPVVAKVECRHQSAGAAVEKFRLRQPEFSGSSARVCWCGDRARADCLGLRPRRKDASLITRSMNERK